MDNPGACALLVGGRYNSQQTRGGSKSTDIPYVQHNICPVPIYLKMSMFEMSVMCY